MRKWFYVLELDGGYFYVGISDNFVRRHRQHVSGKGAVWTKLHEPVRVLFQHQHEVANYRAAELIENEITVRMMIEHGWQKVRGGFFCALEDENVEGALRSHGHWDRVLQSTLAPAQTPGDWSAAMQTVLTLAEGYHAANASVEARDTLLTHLMSLREHRHWRPDLEPGLEEKFWGAKGVLRVLLSIRHNRVIGFKLQDPFAVLASGMQMGRGAVQPWAHLFLIAWDIYRPDATDAQYRRVEDYCAAPAPRVPDRRYDPFVSLLFPEMRWRLREDAALAVGDGSPPPH
jgi:predicted GIY-YIG superfamily endonuclease